MKKLIVGFVLAGLLMLASASVAVAAGPPPGKPPFDTALEAACNTPAAAHAVICGP